MNNRSIFKNKIKIIESEDSKYVCKKTEKNIKELFDYLDSRNFINHPRIIDNIDNEYRYEYIEEKFYPNERKGNDIAELLSNLHYKTSYFKDVSKNKYREIHDKLKDNIEILKKYYDNLINNIETEVFPSPSHYFIERNYSIINNSLLYCEKELKNWFKMVENKNKERVSIVHNNIKTEHFLRSDQGYLINWDNYIIDTPVIDLYKFYLNDSLKYDFLDIFREYNKHFELSMEERKLLFILISMPKRIEEVSNEIINVKNMKYIFDYLYNTSKLISSMNFEEKEAKQTN